MDSNKKTPEIRFKGFTDAWEQRKLKDMSVYKNGTGHEDKQSDTGKYELINLNSISIDGGLKSSGKFINESTETLKKDDLVMILSDVGHGNLLGRVAIIPANNRFVLNQRVALLRPNESVYPKFLYTCINARQTYFKTSGAGSSQLNISKNVVENFEPLIPKKDEQVAISKCFESLDNLITLHQRKYFYKKYSWEQRKLGDIYIFQYGLFNNNPSNGGIYPVYGANGIIGKYTNYNSENSVIIGHMGEYAGSVLWGEGKHFVTYNGTISRPKGDFINPKFGYYMLFQKNINKICGGSGLPFLSYEQLNKIDVNYSKKINEQNKIANMMTNIDNLITLHQLKEMKRSLVLKWRLTM